MRIRKAFLAAAVAAVLAAGPAQLLADPPQYRSGYGPMMGGYGMGPGMMYGHGMGMGPGMMYEHGMGMMHGPMHGMMQGYGPGYGALNLTDEQRAKIARIHQGLRAKQWEIMGKMQDEYARRADAADDASASKAEDQITSLQQQMIGNMAAARKEMDAVLTSEQRRQLRRDGY